MGGGRPAGVRGASLKVLGKPTNGLDDLFLLVLHQPRNATGIAGRPKLFFGTCLVDDQREVGGRYRNAPRLNGTSRWVVYPERARTIAIGAVLKLHHYVGVLRCVNEFIFAPSLHVGVKGVKSEGIAVLRQALRSCLAI